MRFEHLDLNLLVALDALLELRSVSRAARRLHLTQPAISAALSRLRDFFGDELLVSTGRAMLPTAKAEELRGSVREILIMVRSRITTPATFDPATAERKFALCGSDYTFDVLLAEALRRLSVAAPGLSFDFVPIDFRASERLERGDIDIHFTISNYVFPDHPREKLWEDEHCLIAWSEGKFAASISASEFADAGHAIAYFGPDRQPSIAERHYEDLAIYRQIEVKLPSFSMLPAAIVGTDRIATIHLRHALHYARFMPIAIHQLPVPLPRLVGEMQWHKLRENDQGILYLRQFFAACAVECLGPLAHIGPRTSPEINFVDIP